MATWVEDEESQTDLAIYLFRRRACLHLVHLFQTEFGTQQNGLVIFLAGCYGPALPER